MIKPRETFRGSPFANGWLDRVDSAQFQAAVQATMLEMNIRNSAPPDMASAASYQFRMEGAKQFLSILMNLTLEEPAKRTPLPQNLDHRV